MSIETKEDLKEHLQWAIQVELSTIPTYLYAMYSFEDDSADSYRLVRSIVVEEMLHAALVANLLVAVGGHPRFYDEDVIPSYPMDLPHHRPALRLDLEPVSVDFIESVCMPIEHPRPVDGLPEDDGYETIEQFYLAVEGAIEDIDERTPLFENPRRDRQMMDPNYYSPVEFDVEESGGLHPVVDIDSACRAVETVIHQGEGLREEHWADPGHHELTHFYKFQQIATGAYPLGEVRPVPTNPSIDDFDSVVRPVAELFNAAYTYTFVIMDDIYSTTDRESKDASVQNLYLLMSGVLSRLARFLTSQPATDAAEGRAAPTFEFYHFGEPTNAVSELRELATVVAEGHEELTHIETSLQRL